jgi:hypothetical protein
MRAPFAPFAALAGLLLTGALLAGCGDDAGGETATDPGPTTSAASTDPESSAPPSQAPVGVQRTCKELYLPPAQLMPRAIELVHGSSSAEDVADAGELGTGLGAVEAHSLGPLAEDIAVVLAGVDARRAAVESGGGDPDLKAFDAAVNRLARHCEFYVG